MAYCVVADVKRRLLIETSDETYDTQITEESIPEADAFIDALLTPYVSDPSEDLPLDPVPTLIEQASADLAAYFFKRRHMPADLETGPSWFAEGKAKVQAYIKSAYFRGTVIFVTPKDPTVATEPEEA